MLLVDSKVVELKKLDKAIPKNKIKKIVYRFNQAQEGSCEIEINDIDCQSVMLRGDADTIKPAWDALLHIVRESASEQNANDDDKNIVANYRYKTIGKLWRPAEIMNSDLIHRFEDGS